MIAHRIETTLNGDAVEVIILERAATGDETDSEAEPVADWLAASKRSLQEVWDNDEDAVYDRVPLTPAAIRSR